MAEEAEHPALVRLRKLAGRLPEARIEVAGRHAGFSVRRRRFAWFTEDHHGDGIAGLTVKLAAGENQALVDSAPDCFFFPPYLGPKGWVVVRLDSPATDWSEVEELLAESCRRVAPKSLVGRLRS